MHVLLCWRRTTAAGRQAPATANPRSWERVRPRVGRRVPAADAGSGRCGARSPHPGAPCASCRSRSLRAGRLGCAHTCGWHLTRRLSAQQGVRRALSPERGSSDALALRVCHEGSAPRCARLGRAAGASGGASCARRGGDVHNDRHGVKPRSCGLRGHVARRVRSLGRGVRDGLHGAGACRGAWPPAFQRAPLNGLTRHPELADAFLPGWRAVYVHAADAAVRGFVRRHPAAGDAAA